MFEWAFPESFNVASLYSKLVSRMVPHSAAVTHLKRNKNVHNVFTELRKVPEPWDFDLAALILGKDCCIWASSPHPPPPHLRSPSHPLGWRSPCHPWGWKARHLVSLGTWTRCARRGLRKPEDCHYHHLDNYHNKAMSVQKKPDGLCHSTPTSFARFSFSFFFGGGGGPYPLSFKKKNVSF